MSNDRLRFVDCANGKLIMQLENKNGEPISLGECAPLEDGKPISPGATEIFQVEHTSQPGLYDIVSRTKIGPAMVSTPAYRAGYDAIFGSKDVN